MISFESNVGEPEGDCPFPKNDHKRLVKDKCVAVQRVFAQDLAFQPSYGEPF